MSDDLRARIWKIANHLEIWADSLTTGLWCDTCQLPSAISAPCRTVSDEGVGSGGITFTFCPDCVKRNEGAE